ncbi:MAG: hypothetical protein IT361_11995 [Gemmatimonadaceae bacterium]|nr:hypothetical protein [Gemmatimonadaceae bacterium]
MRLEIQSDQTVLRTLFTITGVLAAGDIVLSLLHSLAGLTIPRPVFMLLDLGVEGGVPTLYSSAQLALAAALLGVVAARKPEQRWGWILLAIGFAFLSLDELAAIHEEWGAVARGSVEKKGFFYFRWIAVALVLLPAVLLLFLPLLRSLEAGVRRDFIIAGTIFVGSAVGLEGVGGMVASAGMSDSLGYNLLNVLENGGELIGIALFVGALLRLLAVTPAPSARAQAPREMAGA